MINDIIRDILKSWNSNSSVNSTNEILDWIRKKNEKQIVSINKCPLEKCIGWQINPNNGYIERTDGGFFRIAGMKIQSSDCCFEQPIILQEEIGYLGIICKKINGILHFLMQAKIEPGNINKIQISPTIQATKSNFTQLHGGRQPAYLEYFKNALNYEIIVDQIQSEQSSRFNGKRNRNIIILVDDDVPVLPSHAWMTLKQIKQFMKIDNLVNMDTRTVISCIPFCLSNLSIADVEKYFNDKALANSIFGPINEKEVQNIFHYINDWKMFNRVDKRICKLSELSSWHIGDYEIKSKRLFPYKVVFCNIQIEGREVKQWCQPLFEAEGIATFALVSKVVNNKRLFLVKATHEVGCFDEIELGPSVQLEANSDIDDIVSRFVFEKIKKDEDIIFDTLLSEEGGRFYQEQNRNVIIYVKPDELNELPAGYFWATYKSLNSMQMVNNVLNIQLRNLLSLLRC